MSILNLRTTSFGPSYMLWLLLSNHLLRSNDPDGYISPLHVRPCLLFKA